MTTEKIIEHYENEIRTQIENETFDGINIDNGSFAEACFDSNTEQELAECLIDFHHDAPELSADKTDCKTWDLTPTEWFNQIELGLCYMIAYRIECEDKEA